MSAGGKKRPATGPVVDKKSAEKEGKKGAAKKEAAPTKKGTGGKAVQGVDGALLCACVLQAWERSSNGLDDLLFKRVLTDANQDPKATKVVSVEMRQTDAAAEVRTQTAWAGAGTAGRGAGVGRKDDRSLAQDNMPLFYWAVRVERQDVLLVELLMRVFSSLTNMGYTHLSLSISGKTYEVPIESAKQRSMSIVPKSVIMARKGTGGYAPPDSSGIAHHYVVVTAEDGPEIAINLAYAQFHPAPTSPLSSTSYGDRAISAAGLGSAFTIALEKEMLDNMCITAKPLNSMSCKEADATKRNPLFKQKLNTFFERFSITCEDVKAAGNVVFENKKYDYAVLWYSLGISLELSNKTSELIHIFYGNRSAAYYQLNEMILALQDAEKAIIHAPHWSKGYLRKSAVLTAMGKTKEAEQTLVEMDNVE